MAKPSFAVIGLGRFGRALVEELMKLEAEVLVIDKDYEKIEKIGKALTNTVCLDSTDVEALREVGISNYDKVVVATGMDVDSSILTTLILKDLGVKEVYVKIQSEYHAKVVEKLGVDHEHLIWPERSTGIRLAKILVSNSFLDYFELDDDYSFITLKATDKVIGKNLLELDVRRNFNVNIVAIRRNDKIIIPSSETPFIEGDELLFVGHNDNSKKFSKWLNGRKIKLS
ncbi:TrkA family potassium uptake protein [Hujiaoplasma nucleasis]|uniref:TrkA family potassium uptake protein n=1 Tax=Hujiaoplasma nucleasis TaxID=2725268 RepID=A0A7L6N2G4_9MOLU|nr:TrkA family potassium uptake protein [Hujiaoplasma nucleasis]QLY39741.1 TrkA family potassium uptake protein [Hujiaoplasma nucleasis]